MSGTFVSLLSSTPSCLRFNRWVLAAGLFPLVAAANDLTAPLADWPKVQPTLAKYCYDCHGGKKTKGGVDLKRLEADPSMVQEFALWSKVKDAVQAGDMPPDDSKPLSAGEKEALSKWVGHSIDATVRANAGDPGTVTVRRLTNTEYDHTIRDLTGVDFGFARDFAPDGGGGEGFSNIGDVLFVSPQQLDKYFAAARKLADHATIMPGTGITFQPQRVGLRGPVQVKAQAEQALYVWYQKMAAPYLIQDGDDLLEEKYMTACWQWKYREQTGAASLEQLAREAQLTLPFLENWWAILNSTEPKSRYLDLMRVGWRELPGPDASKPKEVPARVVAKIAQIKADRRSWLGAGKKPGEGTQRHQQDSDGIRRYEFSTNVAGKPVVHIVLGDAADGNKGDWVTFDGLTLTHNKKKEPYLDWLRWDLGEAKKALAAPDADKAQLEARISTAEGVLKKFGTDPRTGTAVKPDAIVVQAPAVITLPLPKDATFFLAGGKLDIDGADADAATVQWTATTDTPPDPTKVIPGRLTVWKRGSTGTRQAAREFEVMKIAFPDEYLRRLEEVARNFQRGGKSIGVYYFSDAQLASVIPAQEKQRWERMMVDWKLIRGNNAQQGKDWDAAIARHLAEFATQAWRRPLVEAEGAELQKIYADARARELDRESAAREVIVRVLVSPNFLFKLEPSEQPGEHKLSPWELATRLSYFLWSSMPDARLRQAAANGTINQPEVLSAEVKRMLKDPKAAALAEEFAGQWLAFNGFTKKNNVDTAKFPEFTPELRADMYREAKEFFTHFIQEDRPVGEIINADYTYLNERLAKFYGVPGVQGDAFRKVNVKDAHRGGLLGMGALLTKTSYPHRTSPVLRGNWLLVSILGTPTPTPPNNVPKLDDSASKATSLRARLEAHRADKACAVCHDKIDPLGFALEGFDAIGRIREKDEAGQVVDNTGEIKNGPKFQGVEGLRSYLATRQGEISDFMCRKMIGYALGRSFLLTDKPLVETMRGAMKKSDERFSAAVLTVVQSRQFQNRRNE